MGGSDSSASVSLALAKSSLDELTHFSEVCELVWLTQQTNQKRWQNTCLFIVCWLLFTTDARLAYWNWRVVTFTTVFTAHNWSWDWPRSAFGWRRRAKTGDNGDSSSLSCLLYNSPSFNFDEISAASRGPPPLSAGFAMRYAVQYTLYYTVQCTVYKSDAMLRLNGWLSTVFYLRNSTCWERY